MTKTHREALEAARTAFNDRWSSNVYGADPLEAAIQTYLSERGQEAWGVSFKEGEFEFVTLEKGAIEEEYHTHMWDRDCRVPVLIIPQPDRKEVVRSAEHNEVSAGNVAQPPQEEAGEADDAGALPTDVVRLVIAARNVAFEDPTPETLRELDQASEAFASRVPWEDEPDEAPISSDSANAIEQYIRRGKIDGLGDSTDGGYLLPAAWGYPDTQPEGNQVGELYAMPSATQTLLDDPVVGIADWLREEIATAEKEAREKHPGAVFGRYRILRDPYSSKPYVLFYVSAPIIVPATEPAAAEDIVGRLRELGAPYRRIAPEHVYLEAANEIERLRAENEYLAGEARHIASYLRRIEDLKQTLTDAPILMIDVKAARLLGESEAVEYMKKVVEWLPRAKKLCDTALSEANVQREPVSLVADTDALRTLAHARKIRDGIPGPIEEFAEWQAAERIDRLTAVCSNFEITGPDDDGVVWIQLHGNGTSGQGLLRVGAIDAVEGEQPIIVQVALALEEDRRAALAKVERA